MEMLDFLWSRAPEVAVTLHAGELTLGMVPPKDLRFHIRQAVEVGHARRIGHGTALAYEDDFQGLLARMREQRVAVEVCLTSSDVILDVEGEDHPFRTYLDAELPHITSLLTASLSNALSDADVVVLCQWNEDVEKALPNIKGNPRVVDTVGIPVAHREGPFSYTGLCW